MIWSATLTVGQAIATPSHVGCWDGTARPCSTSTNLSDNTFVIAGTTYTITKLTIRTASGADPELHISLATGSTVSALLTHDLIVGSTKVQLSTCANALPDPFPYQYGCANPGVSWTVGSSVSLRLENPAVTHEVAATHTAPDGAEEVWSSTLEARSLTNGRGCDNTAQHALRRCSSRLTVPTFRIGSTTYRVDSMVSMSGQLAMTTTPDVPRRVSGWILQVGASRHTLGWSAGNLFVGSGFPTWTSGETMRITLYRSYVDIAAEDARKPASRSGACGSPNLEGLPADKRADEGESAEKGLWHCHGDGVYHRHPDWRARHPAPSQAVRPTGDPLARPPATAPASAHSAANPAARTEGFGNWHSHPDGRFHRHAGGH